jgi:cobalt-precorrin 5A hydrolase / cobalt-factor III methyltransferase / precorrin-3B C17-methyltransferase
MKPAVLALNPSDANLARKIAEAVGGEAEIYAKYVVAGMPVFENPAARLRQIFAQGCPIVAIMACGAVTRILASSLSDKKNEPPVLCVAADASCVVPLVGGHNGGNGLARTIAAAIGAAAAITTAGDVKLGIALDEPPPGYRLANPENAKSVMAALAAGATARLEGEADWLTRSAICFRDDGAVPLRVSEFEDAPGDGLLYRPATLALGIGCERGANPEEAIELARVALKNAGLSPQSLACVASLDLKADEAAIHAVAAHFGIAARFFSAPELEAQYARLANPSETVFAEVGCHGVAEGAALACAGSSGELVVQKTKSRRATCAVARSPAPVTSLPGMARGTLFVVGIGPGDAHWRSPEATAMLEKASDLVGYTLYLDLIGGLADGRKRHDFGLGDEEERCRYACELAGSGRTVALVCSGDAGIYAMATLVFELLDQGTLSEGARRIETFVAPGISALQAAAARTGALLGHDFCTISLSDLLTPWQVIEERIVAAAAADFVVAFYNPASRRRRMQLEKAREILLAHRPPDTPVVLASNLGREREQIRIVDLARLKNEDVDMLTVVLVGSSASRSFTGGDGQTHVYTPRGYDSKAGTQIARRKAREVVK